MDASLANDQNSLALPRKAVGYLALFLVIGFIWTLVLPITGLLWMIGIL